MASLKMTIAVHAGVLALEIARYALNEIVRKSEQHPYGFSGADAAEFAEDAIRAMDEQEARSSDGA